MEWKIGADGRLSWYYDGEFIWGMDSSAFGEYEICADKPGVTEDGQRRKECRRTPPRQLPQEPMSLVMNTAIGTCDGVLIEPSPQRLSSVRGLVDHLPSRQRFSWP